MMTLPAFIGFISKKAAGGTYSVDHLVVAGGGDGYADSAGYTYGGGGGGGQVTETLAVTLTSGVAYTVTVGNKGQDSTFNGITATHGATATNGTGHGATSGNGHTGGVRHDGYTTSGGGGGNGGNGGNGSADGADWGGRGGTGTSSSLSGSAVGYGGGGGGGGWAGSTVYDGGGAGGYHEGNGSNGAANRGGGGGGSKQGTTAGLGAAGVVIIRYAGAQRGTGGTVTSVGGNTIHTFTTSGTYTA